MCASRLIFKDCETLSSVQSLQIKNEIKMFTNQRKSLVMSSKSTKLNITSEKITEYQKENDTTRPEEK